MGTGNLPPVGGAASDDDFDQTVETPSVGGEPTRLIPAVAPEGPSGPGGPPGPYGPTGDDGRRRLLLILTAVVLAAIVAAVIIVLATRSNNSNSASDTTTSSSDSTSSTSSTSSSSTSTSVADTTTTSTEAPTTTASTASTAVQITSFRATSARPSCTVPNPEASSSVPANPEQVTFSWTTTFAATVDISVDGPGVYRSNIGASNSITIPYGCPGPHTYVLTAHGGDGSTTTRTLTITSTR